MTTATTEAPSVALSIGDMAFRTIPAGLDDLEAMHYWKGYARAERAFAKKHGRPGVTHEAGKAPRPGTPEHAELGAELAAAGRAYREAVRPLAHAGGMRAVQKLWRDRGLEHRAAEIVDPLAPVKVPRKRAAAKAAPVESVPAGVTVDRIAAAAPSAAAAAALRAGVESGRVAVLHVGKADAEPVAEPETVEPAPETYWLGVRSRKALRRELAAAMRARGVEPRGEAWARECAAAGLSVGGES